MQIKRRGFTLIELMIAVAVIGILAAIAYPSYQDFVRKGRRADAQSFLMEVAARQQHFLVDRRAYGEGITAAPSSNGLGMTIPSSVSSFYTVTMNTNNNARPPTFSVSAAPQGRQAGDDCGTLAIAQNGAKSAAKTNCW